MNDFAGKYKTLSDRQLLHILQNPEQYVPEAIEAAENEGKTRGFTAAQLSDTLPETSESKMSQRHDVPSPFLALYYLLHDLVLDTLMPKGIPGTEKKLRLICTGYILITVLRTLWRLPAIVRFIESFDILALAAALIDPVFTGVLMYLLWKRNKIGWYIFCSLLCLYIIGEIHGWWLYLTNDMPDILSFFFRKDLADLVPLGVQAAILYFLNTVRARVLFRIRHTAQLLTLGLASLGAILLFLGLLS